MLLRWCCTLHAKRPVLETLPFAIEVLHLTRWRATVWDRRGGGAAPAAWNRRSAIKTNDPGWTINPMYLIMALSHAGLAIGFNGPIAFALLP
jgi:hypothetical protein